MGDSVEKSTVAWIFGLVLGAITTTATAVHVLHEQYITPLKLSESAKKIDGLTAQLDKQSNAIKELEKTKESLDKLNQKLAQIEHSSLFFKGDIYPSTLGSVRIGQPIEKVYETYDKATINASDENIKHPNLEVALNNSIFTSATYSYDKKTRKILTICYILDYQKKLGNHFLETALTNALGEPKKSAVKNQYRWDVPREGSAFLIIGTYYILMADGLQPVIWQDADEE